MSFSHSGRPDAKFRTALILSALLHAAVLALFKPLPLPPLETLGADAVLLVRLVPGQGAGTPQDSPPPSAADAGKPQSSPPARQESPVAAAVQPAQPGSAILNDNTPDTVPDVTSPNPQDEPQQAPAVPAQPDRQKLDSRMVGVLLMVGVDGSVGQIIWGLLPAVTEETLHEMERQLRQKTYPATGEIYSVTEVIDVP